MMKRNIMLVSLCSMLFLYASSQSVGVNTTDPTYTLDVRGTDDQLVGGELQIATPTETNFLRFFSGRLADRNPFLAFSTMDTFHIVTTTPSFMQYNRKMSILPDGKLGMGTSAPGAELDIRTYEADDGAELHLSNSGTSHFLRLFSGKPTNPRPAIFWNFGSTLDLSQFDGNSDYRPFLNLDGKRINVLNNNNSVFLGEGAGLADNGLRNTAIGNFSLRNNISGADNTVIGYAAGGGDSNYGASFSRNVLLGNQAGYNITASDRLYIENSSSVTPLIYGEFDNDLLRINGRQEITGSLEVNRGINTGVALRVNGQEALWSNGDYLSYGFGTDHNYFAKPVKIGPVEGATAPYADLQIVDNSGRANLTLESYGHDAVLQLTGTTNNQDIGWTMRRRNVDGDLEWKHNNLSFMKLTTDARLGLGIPNPQKTLEIAGDSRVFKAINTTATSPIFVSTIENTGNNPLFRNNGLQIIAGNDNFGVNSSQSIFIGFYLPDGTTMGGIQQRNAGGLIFYEMSDRRKKREIRGTTSGIKDLMKIRVRDYKWTAGSQSQAYTTGFIAQELHEVYPYAAKKGGSDLKKDPWQVAPIKLIPLLVKSTQDQQEVINQLRTENEELLKRIERLEKLIISSK